MKAGERRVRLRLAFGVVAVLVVVTWILVPVPFVRGLVAGMVAGPGAVVLGLHLFARRLRRRVGDKLRPPPLPVTAWDYRLDATDMEGRPFDFGSCRGRPVVLNHWATWCAPCVAEMPSLERLRSALADVDVEMACVTQESHDKVKDFMSRKGFNLPVLTVEGDLPECFSSRAIPATFVIDRDGAIVLRHFGAAAWDDPTVVGYIRNLAQAPEL